LAPLAAAWLPWGAGGRRIAHQASGSARGVVGSAGLAHSRPVDLDGAGVRVPDVADHLGHLTEHDRLESAFNGAALCLLRSDFETALLCRDDDVPRRLLARFAGTSLARPVQIRLALAARLFPRYFELPQEVGVDDRLLTGALLGLERLDQEGRLRRLFGFSRRRLGNVVGASPWRRHVATQLRSRDFRRYCRQRLRQV
jgi:hypothetical protein